MNVLDSWTNLHFTIDFTKNCLYVSDSLWATMNQSVVAYARASTFQHGQTESLLSLCSSRRLLFSMDIQSRCSVCVARVVYFSTWTESLFSLCSARRLLFDMDKQSRCSVCVAHVVYFSTWTCRVAVQSV
jgi:hypothetical protein